MTAGLFRRQAVEFQKNRLHGKVLLLPSMSHVFAAIFIVGWVLAGVIWLTTSQYARKETVQGWLEPTSGEVRVYAQNSVGEISEVLVSEGQEVVQGQALIVINGDRILQDGTSLESQLHDELEQQNDILIQQQARLTLIHQQKVSDSQFQLASTQQDLARLDTQIAVMRKRIQLKQQRLAHLQGMSRDGYVAQTESDLVSEQLMMLEGELQRFLRERISLGDQHKLLHSSLMLQPQQHLNELASMAQKQSEIAQQKFQLESQRAQIIRAPKSGVVANLKAQNGIKAIPSVPMLTILPNSSDIEAYLLIPVRAIGFLKPGQQIEIRYDAYPYQKFGLYSGHVSQVADSVSLPAELGRVPQQPSEPVYLVKAELTSNTVSAYGKQLTLKSGMTLSADIQLGDRSLFEWLLEPIYSLQGKV